MMKKSKYVTIEYTNNNELKKMYQNPSNELLTYLKNEKERRSKKNNTGMVLSSFLYTIITILIVIGIIILVILYKGV